MSDWVADLIEHAVRAPSTAHDTTRPSASTFSSPPRAATLPARHAPARLRNNDELGHKRVGYVEKKTQSRVDGGRRPEDEDISSVYNAPPFWAQPRSSP